MNKTIQESPLVTLGIIAYKQERYIGAAIEGAFSQTYSPLEIILSDDRSPDGTFSIMERMASAYRGPHKVVLNRNPNNLGLVGHVNRVADLASGELIVGAAGDDISLPERVSLTVEAWEFSGRRATSIHGQFIVIDQNGTETGQNLVAWPKVSELITRQSFDPAEFLSTLKHRVQGSTHTFAKRLFTEFGPLPAYMTYEDTALAFRSMLAGEIYFIDRPLVKYRRHAENTFAPVQLKSISNRAQLRAYHQQVARETARHVRMFDGFRADVEAYKQRGKLTQAEALKLSQAIDQGGKIHRLKHEFFEAGFFRRFFLARNLIKHGAEKKYTLGRLMPQFLTEFISIFRRQLRRGPSA